MLVANHLADARPKVLLELDPLRAVFLHEVGARHRAFEIGLEAQLFFQIVVGSPSSLSVDRLLRI